MIAECAQDLFTKIGALGPLASSVGLAIGGKEPDTGMAKLPLPAAWILPASGVNKIPDNFLQQPPTKSWQLATYVVLLHVPYGAQSDLVANQYPLLENVVVAVHGTTSPGGARWWLK
ncbi:MAG: hypothetical protein ACP5GF_12810, partial [Thiomonas sp.]